MTAAPAYLLPGFARRPPSHAAHAALIALFVLVAAAVPAAPPTLLQALDSPSPDPGDEFGWSLAVGGGNIFVGSPEDNQGTINAGSVYVFNQRNGDFRRTIVHPEPADGDGFGSAMAPVGKHVLVGAPFARVGNVDGAGKAYLIRVRNGQPRKTITNPVPAPFNYFGYAVDKLGRHLLIGEPGATIGGLDSAGAAHVVHGRSGRLIRSLTDPTPTAGRGFGATVLGSGGRAFIGAPGFLEDAPPGPVYQFRGRKGRLARTFEPSFGSGIDSAFGQSMARAGRNLVVGQPFESIGVTTDTGVVRVFRTRNNALRLTIPNPEPQPGDGFGYAVAVSGKYLYVGAPFADRGAPGSGVVYVFLLRNGRLLQTLGNPSPEPAENFGFSLAGLRKRIAIGSPGDMSVGVDSGRVYIFKAI